MQEEQISQVPQVAQPTAPIQTPAPAAPTATVSYEYAGFWVRAAAAIIDGIILSVVNSIIGAMFGGGFGPASLSQQGGSDAGDIAGLFSIWMISVLINGAYYVGLTGLYGATLGKRVLGLRVVDSNGQMVGLGKAALRELIGKFVSGIVIGLGYLWVAFDEKKQGWHDKIAGTYVIKTK